MHLRYNRCNFISDLSADGSRHGMKSKSRIIKQIVEQKSKTTLLDHQFRKYLDFLRLEKNLSPHTLTSYKFDFGKYRSFLVKDGIQSASKVTEEHISKFLAVLHRRTLSPRSVARILSTIRGFHRYLLGEEVVTNDPTQIIDITQTRKNTSGSIKYFRGG